MMIGFGIIGLVVMILFWAALIFGALLLVRGLFPKSGGVSPAESPAGQSARSILDQRYARGEVTRDQYEIMKQDIDS